MSEFINTIDSLGDELTLGKLIEKSLSEIKDNVITKVKANCFYANNGLISVNFPNVESVGAQAFRECKNLATAILPNVINIGSQCFQQTKLLEADFSYVTDVPTSAFYSCTNLKTVNLPNVTNIGNGAFSSCSSLTIVNLPSVTNIENSAFNKCSSLTSIDIPLVTSIGAYAFDGTSLETVILRSEALCTLLATSAFNSTPIASGSGYIYVPRALIDSYKSATNWSTYAAQFRILEDYTVDGTTTGEFQLPSQTRVLLNRRITEANSSVESVGYNAFADCSKLTSVNLYKATSIEERAFYACKSLQTVDLYKAISIGKQAFGTCYTFTTLILRSETIATLSNSNAFEQCCHFLGTTNSTYNPNGDKDGYIYVPRALIEDYKVATNWAVYSTQFRAIEDYPEICGGDV